MSPSMRDLSNPHEEYLARVIGGRTTPGSGNQPANQADARGDVRRQRYAFAVDGKATMSGSITVRLADWRKIEEQAHDEFPALGLRWYLDGTMRRTVDLVVISADMLAELLDQVNR